MPQVVAWIWSGGTPSSISIARTAASQTTGAPVRFAIAGRVAVVVEGGVADEDHVGRLEVVRGAGRERVLRQERIDQDPVRRPDDLVAGGAEVREPRAHRQPLLTTPSP